MTRFLVAAAAVALTAACASNPSSFGPVANTVQPSASRSDAAPCAKSVVYVATDDASIKVYDAKNLGAGPCGSLHGFSEPEGLFADSKGNLWVADAGSRAIYEFAPAGKSPVQTLSDPNGVPTAVTVDERHGTVYAVEYSNDVAATTLSRIRQRQHDADRNAERSRCTQRRFCRGRQSGKPLRYLHDAEQYRSSRSLAGRKWNAAKSRFEARFGGLDRDHGKRCARRLRSVCIPLRRLRTGIAKNVARFRSYGQRQRYRAEQASVAASGRVRPRRSGAPRVRSLRLA